MTLTVNVWGSCINFAALYNKEIIIICNKKIMENVFVFHPVSWINFEHSEACIVSWASYRNYNLCWCTANSPCRYGNISFFAGCFKPKGTYSIMHGSLKHAVQPAVGQQFSWYHFTKHSYYERTAGGQTGACWNVSVLEHVPFLG